MPIAVVIVADVRECVCTLLAPHRVDQTRDTCGWKRLEMKVQVHSSQHATRSISHDVCVSGCVCAHEVDGAPLDWVRNRYLLCLCIFHFSIPFHWAGEMAIG